MTDDDAWEARMDSYIEEAEKQITALRAAHEAELRRTQSLETALARMEALVEYAEHQWSCVKDRGHPCDCGLDELLAACERKEAGK